MYKNGWSSRQTSVSRATQPNVSVARTLLKAVAATALFAAVHSVLASEVVKDIAASLVGRRRRDTFYRAGYNAQALGATVWLFFFIRSLPDRNVYEVRGTPAYLMRAGQAGSIAALAYSVYSVGILNFIGIPQLVRGSLARKPGPQTIEAQGPARWEDGTLLITGPFRIQRHPTNFWPIGVLWLQPRMSHAGLAFSIVGSVYLLAGSYHQDGRLRRAYGEQYETYRRETPLFLPRPKAATVLFRRAPVQSRSEPDTR